MQVFFSGFSSTKEDINLIYMIFLISMTVISNMNVAYIYICSSNY